MPKFKKGQIVQVDPDLNIKSFGIGVVDDMHDFAGKIVTITHVKTDSTFGAIYQIKECPHWNWTENMFLPGLRWCTKGD